LKKPLVPLILAFELFGLIFLSGCVFENFDISKLRYFKPKGCASGTYEITLNADEFSNMRFQVEKKVKAIYTTNEGKIVLESAQFKNSLEMHEFWHKWTNEHFSLTTALNSEWWWFSGKVKSSSTLAWYKGRVVFILSSDNELLLEKVKKELDVFVKTFSGVKS
jgi:hypothetical protein